MSSPVETFDEQAGAERPGDSEVVKLSVNISVELAAALREVARQRGQSMTEVIRHGIGIEKFLQDEVIGPKAKLMIETADGERMRVVFAGI